MAELGLKARFITRRSHQLSEVQTELNRLGFEWTTAPYGYQWGSFLLGKEFYLLFVNVWGVLVTSWMTWLEMRRWKPTHLFCMNWTFFTYAMPTIIWSRLPLIYRAGDELPLHTPVHRWVSQKLLDRTDSLVCISKHIKKRFATERIAHQKMRVIYNYPPARAQSRLPPLPSVPADAAVLVYLGQVSARKGVVVLLDAVERMIEEGKNLVLWIVGEPSWGDELLVALKQRVQTSGLEERVLFFGYVQNVIPLLVQSDIHVCPSLEIEALSNVVLEAKLCGKPSVVFPTGGLPELIEHGVDGYICRDCTVEALGDGIDYFVKNPDARYASGKAARRSLEEKFGQQRFRHEWSEAFLTTARQPASMSDG
jgi:glycosyltransferase involved in cell wall biosynthesis